MSTAPPIRQAPLAEDPLLSAFEGRIEKIRTSPLYLIGLAFVAGAMVLLPLIYLGLIALVAYGLYYHAVNNVPERGHEVTGILYFLAYVIPLLVGLILLVFMVKPFFAPRRWRDKRISLVRQNEPTLFAFVDRLCEVLGAPKPARIDVNCELNAGAGFRDGLAGLLTNKMTLVIGMPLVAGLSLREFAGALAHEFGHFSQGFGMRFTYIIDSVNAWFARLVYERDAWDLWLIAVCTQRESTLLRIIGHVARFLVYITRRILWVLLMAGHAISCGMSRQMEYNADLRAARLVGSKADAEKLRRLLILSIAKEAVQSDLGTSWRDGRLPDDLPALIMAKTTAMPADTRDKILASAEEGHTRYFDTHPTNAQRIARMLKEDAPGVFRARGKASALFSDFPTLCKVVTFSYYQDVLGPSFSHERLVPTQTTIRGIKKLDKASMASDRYFLGVAAVWRPLKIDPYSEVFQLPPEKCISRLKRARQALASVRPIANKALKRLFDARTEVSRTGVAHRLRVAKINFDGKRLNLPDSDLAPLAQAHREAEREEHAATEAIAKIETVLKLRMECVVRLLREDGFAERIPDAERMRKQAGTLLEWLSCIQQVSSAMPEVLERRAYLQILATLFQERKNDEGIAGRIDSALGDQFQALSELRFLLKEYDYPYDHADGRITMLQYAMTWTPSKNDGNEIMQAVEQLVERMQSLFFRVMGDLATIGENVEKALGLPPMETETNIEPNPAT